MIRVDPAQNNSYLLMGNENALPDDATTCLTSSVSMQL